MAYKLDIFETLAAIDQNNLDYFSKLTEEEKKGFAPPVVLKWASSVDNGVNAQRYLRAINQAVNVNFWEISDHPELQYKLMAMCGIGLRQHHNWIALASSKTKANIVTEFLQTFWPNSNDLEIEILINQFTDDIFEDFVKTSGLTPEEETEILKAYGKHYGRKKKSR